MFCKNCGAKINDNASFCKVCGTRVKTAMPQQQNPVNQSQPNAINQGQRVFQQAASYAARNIVNRVGGMPGINAASQPGEFVAGEMGGVISQIRTVAGTGQTLLSGLKNMGKGLANPGVIISVIVMAVVWIVQIILTEYGVNNAFFNATKLLTFANGGMGRNALGLIGGLLGKGAVAGAVATLLTGGGSAVIGGFKGMFQGSNFKKNTIGWYLLGLGIAMMLYQFFTGNATIGGLMAAVSGMVISLRALGGRAGIIFSLVQSLTAKKGMNGLRYPEGEKPKALFAGFALGFAGTIPLSIIPLYNNIIPLIVGAVLTVTGIILAVLGVEKTTRYGAAAMAAAIVAGSLFMCFSMPVMAGTGSFTLAMSTQNPVGQKPIGSMINGRINSDVAESYLIEMSFHNVSPFTVSRTPDGYHILLPSYDVSRPDNEYVKATGTEMSLTGTDFAPPEQSRLELTGFSRWTKKPALVSTFILDKPVTYTESFLYIHGDNGEYREWADYTAVMTDMSCEVYLWNESLKGYPEGSYPVIMLFSWTIQIDGDEYAQGPDYYQNQGSRHELSRVPNPDKETYKGVGVSVDYSFYTTDFEYDWDSKEDEKKDVVVETDAKKETGEDEVIIDTTIIGGKDRSDNKGRVPAAAVAVGSVVAALVGGAGATGSKENDPAEERKKKYKLKIYKDFGDEMTPGDVKMIYARIVEVDPKTGAERDRADLSSAIQIFCDDNSFDVQMQNGLYGNYKGAQMKIAEGYSGSEGHVCFQYVGAGGSFTNRVRFKVMGPMLEFDQPNIAIPHDWDKPMKPYFVVLGMGQNHKVTAEITPNDAFDLNITEGESLGTEAAKLYYANITPRSNAPKMDDREAGAAMSYILKVEAYDEATKAKASNELPIARVKTGITLTTKNINCFWYKHVTNEIAEYDGLRRRMVVRDKFAKTEAELKLIYFDEENYKMKVLAPLPKAFSLKAEDKEEQELVDKLRIQMDPGDDPAFGPEGGLKVTLQPTKGYLDAPRRIKTKVHIEASANNTVYAADQEIILCSQPDRSHMDLPQISAAIREDEQIEERLRHLQSVIKRDCYSNLFPVYKMIQAMLDGYDSEYGYDEEQLATVINTYNGFCRGEIAGANAEPAEGETLMDYMLWAIDAMGDAADRLEKKAGFLGRLALGFATAGMSEIAFTTMDIVRVPYRMKQAMEQGGDTVLGVMWAGAKEVVVGELQGRVAGAIQSGAWVVAKGFAEGAKNPKLFNIVTKAETKYLGYAEKIQKANAKTTIYKDGVFKNPFKVEVDPGAAAAGAKQAKLQQKELDALADAKIKESRLKNGIKGETEFGVHVRERADGSLEVVGRDLSDPAVAASFQGYEKVVNMQRAQNKLRQAVTTEAKLEARAELEGCMREVRQDFIAQDQLKNYNKLYADDVRLEYDNYWTEMDLRVDRLAAEKIAARTGKNPNDIYCYSVSTNKKDYVHHRHGVDHDMTMMEKVGEGKPDIEINDRIQAEENAMAVYETLTGEKASSVNEAMEFAEKYQYTTVAGEGQYAKEKYGDVAELLTTEGAGRRLQNVEMDASAMQYKVEQFAEKAEMKLAEAEKYPHGSKEYINARSQAYRDFFEANRTGYKQMKRSIMARNEALMLQGKGNKLSQKEQLCYTLLERYYEGARQGHLNIDSGDLMNSMKEIGINSTRDLAVMMNEMTYKVADGI